MTQTPNLCCGCVQTIGQFHLGEFVNRFRAGSLVMKLPDSEAAKIPTVLFGTINGSIGVVASLPQQQFAYLSRLQVRSCWQHEQPAALRMLATPELGMGSNLHFQLVRARQCCPTADVHPTAWK